MLEKRVLHFNLIFFFAVLFFLFWPLHFFVFVRIWICNTMASYYLNSFIYGILLENPFQISSLLLLLLFFFLLMENLKMLSDEFKRYSNRNTVATRWWRFFFFLLWLLPQRKFFFLIFSFLNKIFFGNCYPLWFFKRPYRHEWHGNEVNAKMSIALEHTLEPRCTHIYFDSLFFFLFFLLAGKVDLIYYPVFFVTFRFWFYISFYFLLLNVKTFIKLHSFFLPVWSLLAWTR